MDFKTLWVEKYRPKNLGEMVISDENRGIIESFQSRKDVPHLLFTSGAGMGKTTLAKIIVNDILKCDYLYINASDENGIDTIRNKIVSFSQNKSFDGGIKVVICDEACGISVDAQRCLRNVMEEYAGSTRFILTANYKHKIIPPIQSRCQSLDFTFDIKNVAKHIFGILQKENIVVPQEEIPKLKVLIKSHFPDIRKTINDVQKYSLSGTLNIKGATLSDKFVEDIFNKLKTEEVFEIREFLIKNETVFQSDYHNLMKNLLNYIYESDLESMKKKEAILIITEYMYRHTFVMDIEINSFACFINLSKLLLGA